MLELLKNFWFLIIGIPTLFGFIFTLMKLYANGQVINKLQNNDIHHLSKDLQEHKSEYKEFKTKFEKEDKEFKKEIRDELHLINLGMNRVERKVIKLEIKEEVKSKHKKDK